MSNQKQTPTINKQPYRLALEALVSSNPPKKIRAMFGKALSNLDDPMLREILKGYTKNLEAIIRRGDTHIRPLSTVYFDGSAEVVEYIEDIIDSETIWQLVAARNGWQNGDANDDIVALSEEHGRKALVVAPSDAVEELYSYWVVWDDDDSPQARTIMWTCISKDIYEAEGPVMNDCPLYFFELAPNIKNLEWRNHCIRAQSGNSESN